LSDAGVQPFGQLVFGYNSSNQELEVISVEGRKPGSSTFASGSAARLDEAQLVSIEGSTALDASAPADTRRDSHQ
jgi:hypothetical protein